MEPAQYSMRGMKLKRLRRPNFSTVELETLVDILENYAELTVGKLAYQTHFKHSSPDGFQKAPGWTSKNRWEEVAVLLNNSECNSADRVERTAKEVREKWIDFKCRLKKRYRYVSALGLNASSSSPNSGTSSGADPHLTGLDLKALKLLNNAQKKIRGNSKMPDSEVAAKLAGRGCGRSDGQGSASRVAPLTVTRVPLPPPASNQNIKDWQQALLATAASDENSLQIIPLYSNGLSNAQHSPQSAVQANVDVVDLNSPSERDTQFDGIKRSCSSSNDYPDHTMDDQLHTDFSEDNSTTGGYVGEGGQATSTTTADLLGVVAQKQDRVIDLMMELVSETGQRRAVEEEAVGLLRHLVALQARRVELEEIKMGIRSTPGNDLDT